MHVPRLRPTQVEAMECLLAQRTHYVGPNQEWHARGCHEVNLPLMFPTKNRDMQVDVFLDGSHFLYCRLTEWLRVSCPSVDKGIFFFEKN